MLRATVKWRVVGGVMQLHIANDEQGLARRLEAVSWGLFFVWIGVAILLNVGWGWGLLGIAAIILGGAAIRSFKGLPVEGLWVTIGVVLLVCAIWEFFAISWPMLPVFIIGFGVVMLLRAFRGPQSRAR